jgi:O-antigen/teichoic acid export membrane protein
MSQVSRGFIWSAAERFSIQGVSFVLGIIIARIVSPSAYGLIVMIQVFITFSQLFIDGGFANALIQKKDRNDTDYCTVFLFNMGIALLLYLLFFLCAPLIARFYEEPQLITITRVIALNLIFSSLSIVQKTRLTINLDFKTQTKAGLIAVIISGTTGIVCAYAGLEVWALVIQGLLNQLIGSIMLMYYSHWQPRLVFSVDSFKRLFSFGSKLMLSNILTGIYINLNNLIIGKKYTSADLAFYNRGFTLSQFPSANVAEVMNRIIYPVLSEVQDNNEELKKAYIKYLHLSHYIILPLMGLMIVLAKPLILVLLTDKWLETVPYIQIFCLNFMLYPIILQSSNPVAAIGHSGILLKYQMLKRGVSLAILIYTFTISINAICWGVVIGSLFEVMVNLFILRKEIGIGIREQVKSQMDVVLAVLASCGLVYLLLMVVSNPYGQLFIGGALGVIAYFVFTFIFNIQEKEIIVGFFSKFVSKK